MTVNYLQALNYLFERGFLSHDKITSMDSHVLCGMEHGCSDWLDELLGQGKYIMSDKINSVILDIKSSGLLPTNPYQRSFLAWQVNHHI